MSEVNYEALSIVLSESGAPTPILGIDPSRIRSLIRASVAGVYVGHQSNLASALGAVPSAYLLPASPATSDEFKSTDELYAVYRPGSAPAGLAAIVYIMVESEKIAKPVTEKEWAEFQAGPPTDDETDSTTDVVIN